MEKIAIVGAGLIGRAWANVFARAGWNVRVWDPDMKQRAEAVMTHMRDRFKDPDLDKEVGMLWLGEEFAQLENEFCAWKRSSTGTDCSPEELNRSAFVAWIDCQL
jgi:3-hydroxyacyl-CoA dehydrogenase